MQVTCPTCRKDVQWNSKSEYRPFCSKRCQLIDLGEWSDEKMAIPVSNEQSNNSASAPDIEEIEAMLASQTTDFFKN